jgi:NADH:ubiquinone reductase (H+-translocating)
LIFGAIVGAFYSVTMRQVRRGYTENLMTAATFGVPLWGLVNVVVAFARVPNAWLEHDGNPGALSHAGRRVLFWAFLGVLNQVVTDLVSALWGEEQPTVPIPIPVAKKRIVILGCGFAGLTTAQCLEKELEKDLSVQVTLVSESNALLFTPMLRLSSWHFFLAQTSVPMEPELASIAGRLSE